MGGNPAVLADVGSRDAFTSPGFAPAYIRPLYCRGIGPFWSVALSGDPRDFCEIDTKVKELLPDNTHLHNWSEMAREHGLKLPAILS